MQTTCSFECAMQHGHKKSERQRKKAANTAKREFRDSDVTHWKKKAQEATNRWIREVRDADKPCISCGYIGNGRQWHAGHYKSQGGNSSLRYHEWNIHKQCSICNNHLSGNLAEYRKNLIDRIGEDQVIWLESSAQKKPKTWTIEELKEIHAKYTQLHKEHKSQSTIYDII